MQACEVGGLRWGPSRFLYRNKEVFWDDGRTAEYLTKKTVDFTSKGSIKKELEVLKKKGYVGCKTLSVVIRKCRTVRDAVYFYEKALQDWPAEKTLMNAMLGRYCRSGMSSEAVAVLSRIHNKGFLFCDDIAGHCLQLCKVNKYRKTAVELLNSAEHMTPHMVADCVYAIGDTQEARYLLDDAFPGHAKYLAYADVCFSTNDLASLNFCKNISEKHCATYLSRLPSLEALCLSSSLLSNAPANDMLIDVALVASVDLWLPSSLAVCEYLVEHSGMYTPQHTTRHAALLMRGYEKSCDIRAAKAAYERFKFGKCRSLDEAYQRVFQAYRRRRSADI